MDKISHLYKDYADILEEFGRDRIQDRFNDLYSSYKNFITDVRINDFTLMHAILDYFTDVSRLKRFHEISRANTFKVVSYEVSWLLRRKPLQVLTDNNEKLVYVNEKFILSYIVSYLTQLVGSDFYESLTPENKNSFDGFIDSLYYYLKYRNCSSQALEFALLSFGAGVVAANHSLHIENTNQNQQNES